MDNEIPIIDLTDLISGKDAAGVADEIGAACRGVGFFYVTGHGIPDEVTRRFFCGIETLLRSDARNQECGFNHPVAAQSRICGHGRGNP